MLIASLPAVVTTAISRLFQNQFADREVLEGVRESSTASASRGRIWMSRVKTSVGILNDVESIQSIGKSVIAQSRITSR